MADAAIVFASSAPALATECVVESDPASATPVSEVVSGWFEGVSVRVLPFLREGVGVRDPVAELQGRASLWLPVLLSGALAAILAVLWWARRQEFAVYRIMGANRIQLLGLITTEVIVTIWIPAAIGAGLVVIFTSIQVSSFVTRMLVSDYFTFGCLLSLLPLLGLAVVTARDAVDAVRGR